MFGGKHPKVFLIAEQVASQKVVNIQNHQNLEYHIVSSILTIYIRILTVLHLIPAWPPKTPGAPDHPTAAQDEFADPEAQDALRSGR